MIKRSTLTRRETLKVTTGMVMLGAGVSAVLAVTPATAAASPAYELRFFKKKGAARTALDSIALPAALAAEIDAGRIDQIEFVWHVKKGDKQTKLAEYAAPARDKVAAIKKKKAG